MLKNKSLDRKQNETEKPSRFKIQNDQSNSNRKSSNFEKASNAANAYIRAKTTVKNNRKSSFDPPRISVESDRTPQSKRNIRLNKNMKSDNNVKINILGPSTIKPSPKNLYNTLKPNSNQQ